MNELETILTRRTFLKTLSVGVSGALLQASSLEVIGKLWATGRRNEIPPLDTRYDFILPRVKFDCDNRVPDAWNISPGGDWNLLMALKETVRCKVKFPDSSSDYDPYYGQAEHFNAIVDFSELPPLKNYPFLFMTAEGEYTFNDTWKKNLKRYLTEGGFLLMDDCVFNGAGDFFYQSSYKLLEEVFGKSSVQMIPKNHEVFHTVFDHQALGQPHLHGVNHGARGVFLDNRLAVFLCSTDIHCGWNDRLGRWFGVQKHKQSIELGINIIMYALSH
jgi:hypothetical protein